MVSCIGLSVPAVFLRKEIFIPLLGFLQVGLLLPLRGNLSSMFKPDPLYLRTKKGYYTSAVSIFSAGNSFRWIRDNLCKDCPPDTDAFNIMNRMAESVPAGSNGILFNPSLAGGSSQEPSCIY